MQYVMFMIPSVYGSADADEMPSPEMVDAMMTYNQELADAGVLESLNGLHPPTAGVQVRFGADGSSVSEMESAGAVGGYWILNVSSHEAAVEWARRCPALPGDVLELRQIQQMDDFPEDVQDVVAGYDL
ncbi:MAG: YciI family protein [Candidatus Nanopelagicales bacterium]|jgi:hypothetical protein|nr:MAG: YciI family protein [Actinomycetota bacterium]HNL52138.1 YciI family protein [Actinomycetota bacterium]HUM87100.1 YciI family protein [Actinomycetota bacterium]